MKRVLLFVTCVLAAVPSWADEIVWFSMDSSPGWKTEGQWKFGVPQGLGGPESYDPVSGHTGKNVYGYNLAGNYESYIPQYCLTTPAIYCGLAENVTLSFWRWLGVESGFDHVDHAKVQVSNDGSNWTDVWTNGAVDIIDTSWVHCEYDISSVADRQPTVFVRWCMGPTSFTDNYAGWNIDDVCLSGDLVDAASVSPDEPFQSGGPLGGPMTPTCKSYTITNSGTSPLDWTTQATQPWLDITPNAGTLPPDATVVVDVCINAYAYALPQGSYTDTVSFTNTSSGFTQPIGVMIYAAAADELLVPVQYPTIQSAINAAGEGDTVVVLDGTYTGNGNLDLAFFGKAMTLKSARGPDNCIIASRRAAGDGGFLFAWGEGPGTVVEGFAIDGCTPDRYAGGGIYCVGSSPTIKNCIIRRCSAYNHRAVEGVGGAIYCDNASPTIVGCAIVENLAGNGGRGGGIACTNNSRPVIVNCSFTGNYSANWSAGAMYNIYSAPILINCLFSDNWAAGNGGGICNWSSDPTLISCVFINNSASGECGAGGAMFNEQSNATLTNCTFVDNWADPSCGTGGAILDSNSKTTLTNCILWGNSSSHGTDEAAQIYTTGVGAPIVNYSCVQGWTGGLGGTGNIGDDPLFVAPDVNDFHLLSGSPCVDAGDNAAVPLDVTTDYDGNPRFFDDPSTGDTGSGTPPIVDMGAYELQGEGSSDRRKVDFDGDGESDLLWHRISTGANFVTLMGGRLLGSYRYVGGRDPDILLVELGGDFDDSGTTDLLWHRTSTSAHFVTLMDGGVPGPYQYVGGGGDPDIGVIELDGDFDGNGTTDLLWHRTSTNAHFVTLMTGGVPGPHQHVGGGGDHDIAIVGLGDCDGSGTTDLLWHRTSTGGNFVTLMDGGLPGSYQYLGGDPDIDIIDVGDFDGNGKTDLLWHRTSTGANFVTLMDGAVPGPYQHVGGGGDHDIGVIDVGDFDGNGTTDLLWHRTSTGAHFVTLMDGAVPGPYQYIGGAGDPDLGIVGLGDFDGNGKSDLLWHRTSTGANFVTLMDGAVPGPYQYVGGDPDIWIINLE